MESSAFVVVDALPENHVPAPAEVAPPDATASLALVSAVWGIQEDEESASPLASVTMTWDSPVVFDVTRKGTPARRSMLPSRTLTRRRSPRLTCSATFGAT